MRLQWPEIRTRAAAFAEEWKAATRESADKQTFWNEFFTVFGVDRKQVAVYERRVQTWDAGRRGFIDLFIPGQLIVEQKSAGLDLRAASKQAFDYFDWLPEAERPRFILTCDFQRWHLTDLETGRDWRFPLKDLKRHVEQFWFLVGTQPRLFRNQSPANAAATKLMGSLHEALKADGYTGHALERLLVRLLFILFADHTGIFETKNQFLVLLEQRTAADGSDLGGWLTRLFAVLDTDYPRRQASLDGDLAAFPYVNGRLFSEQIAPQTFDHGMRRTLLEAAAFRWDEVSPAIFGALFESVIDAVTQRRQGAHYTPEACILRVIGPLFLDDLRAEFERAKARVSGRREALQTLHSRMIQIRVIDPACGAGNFLVIAFRELRELEREIIKELYARFSTATPDKDVDVSRLSQIKVSHFYGIEIDEFPALIAETAMWMTAHIANVRLGEDFGQPVPTIPLKDSATIDHADALEIDWNDVLPAAQCTYVLGNPPFAGQSYQSPTQRAQMARIVDPKGKRAGSLDYVAAWFLKAGAYVAGGEGTRIGFVATNSITQGEQVAQLWPTLFGRYALEIAFAHRTFAWPGKANVHCVIVGLAPRGSEPAAKRLFSYGDIKAEPTESEVPAITAYLFGAAAADRHGVVVSARQPENSAPPIRYGTQPIDGGNLILDAAERRVLLDKHPILESYIRLYVGSEEYINGGMRWIICLADAPPPVARLADIKERLNRVRNFRSASIRPNTRDMANAPADFHFTTLPTSSFMVIPEVSSERRDYVPLGWLEPPTIPSNLVRVLLNATLYHFGILTSRMHMAWLRHIGGRLKSDFRYSIGLVYNTFPWPDAIPVQVARIGALAQAVLDARALPKNATSTLADLYDPDTMPAELRKAHAALDAAVDRLYRPAGYDSDRARVEHLFTRYRALVEPTSAAAALNRKQVRRVIKAAVT